MKNRLPIVLAVGLCLWLGACAGLSEEDVQSAESLMPGPIELAERAEARGDWSAAARHWRDAAGPSPDRELRLAWARALRLSGSCGRAAGVLAPLLTAADADGTALIESAKCHLVSGRPEAAETQLRQALEAMPESWQAQSALGVTLDRTGRHTEAMRHHDRANALAPGKPILMSNKALSLALNGRLEEAVALMREAAAIPGATERVRMNLALLEAASGRGDRAATIASQEEIDDKTDELLLLRRIAEASRRAEQSP